jgi:predicted dehydrogenase
MIGVGVIGCGNVAPFYLKTLPLHPELELVGVFDRDQERASRFSAYYSVSAFRSLDELLGDRRVGLVINLTTPRSHYPVSKECLEAGKHVYSEKPLATSLEHAKELVEISERKGVLLASAPSRVLAETAQTFWKALREGAVGKALVAYAEMDGGLIHRTHYTSWLNELDIPWPYKDEFEAGCTLEHAGYPVSWLTAFFGPVETVTGFSSCQVPDKGIEAPLITSTPDISVGCLKFASGMVARVTSSWLAPADHSLRVFGEQGVLCTDDLWQPRASVYIKRNLQIGQRTIPAPWKYPYSMVRPPRSATRGAVPRERAARQGLLKSLYRGIKARVRHLRGRVDFCLGPAEMAASIEQGRPCRLSARYCLHTTEVVLAIHNALDTGAPYKMTTSFDPLEPERWAR